MVKWSVAYTERVALGARGFVVCRSRYIDDSVSQSIENGMRQMVILGAGLDSRAYRDEMLKTKASVFEVDHPASQAYKIALVKRIIGDPLKTVSYVPVDFDHETLDKLISHGFDKSVKTLFVWEGVTYYLTAEAVDATLGWIRTHTSSAVIFDYLYKSSLTGMDKGGDFEGMQRYHRRISEGLTFGIERGAIQTFLLQRGFTNVVETDSSQLKRLYCTGVNQGRDVADIYSIVVSEI